MDRSEVQISLDQMRENQSALAGARSGEAWALLAIGIAERLEVMVDLLVSIEEQLSLQTN